MAWTGLTLTVDGRNALNQAQQANTMNIKSVVIGDGAAPSNYSTQKNLVHQLYELTELKIDTTDVGCDITTDFPKVDYDYYFREVGVIVTIGGKDVLYVYDNCGDDAQYIVNSTDAEENKKRIRLSLAISDVSQITVSTPSTLYVSYDDFETSLDGKLGVNGNASDTVVSFEEPDQNQNLKSGERLSVAFGKVAKAIKTLISHVADKSNPHGVTKEQIGLESVENKSSDDIRSELTTGDIIGALGYTPFNPSLIVNTLNIENEGYVLDARQGKVIKSAIDDSNTNISNLDYIALAESLGWNRCIVRGTKWSDLGEAYAACIPLSDCVSGETYLVKLNNGSIHRVTMLISSVNDHQVGVHNGTVLLGYDIDTATKGGISSNLTIGKKAWITGSHQTEYTINSYSGLGAPIVISASSAVLAWYCKISDSPYVKQLMTQYPTVTEAGQYAVDAVELNSSVDGTLANKIATIENDIDTLTKNTRNTTVYLNAYNTADNLYTFPNDGYVYISSENVTSGFVRVALYSSQGVNYPMGYMYQTITGAWQTQTTYVRKGMKMYCPIATDGTKVTFYSF